VITTWKHLIFKILRKKGNSLKYVLFPLHRNEAAFALNSRKSKFQNKTKIFNCLGIAGYFPSHIKASCTTRVKLTEAAN
jgi:hypothetical protein